MEAASGLFGVFLAFCHIASSAPVCPYKVCDCHDNLVICRDLPTFPTLMAVNSTGIDTAIFQGGKITSIPGNSLPPGLINLYFTGHPLTNISRDAFNTVATTLNELSFDRADFRQLPEALLTLTNLTALGVADVIIDDWDSAPVKSLANTLNDLNLVSVNLVSWPSWLSLFTSLEEVQISDTPLRSIPDSAFNGSRHSLKHLTLSNCSLTKVPAMLSQFTNLSSLELSYNDIKDVIKDLALFPCRNTLTGLFLASIGLTTFPDLRNFTQLTRVTLDKNHIANSEGGSLLPSLTRLSLKDCGFHSVPNILKKLSNLSDVDLSYNQIEQFSFDMFPPSITSLDLSYNRITDIEESNITNYFLSKLKLNSNPISNISDTAFQNVSLIETLSLDNTSLTQIPIALTSLIRIKWLFMRNTSTLLCPCPQSPELAEWYKSVKANLSCYITCSFNNTVYDYRSPLCESKTTTTTTVATTRTCGNNAAHTNSVASTYYSVLVAFVLFLYPFVPNVAQRKAN